MALPLFKITPREAVSPGMRQPVARVRLGTQSMLHSLSRQTCCGNPNRASAAQLRQDWELCLNGVRLNASC